MAVIDSICPVCGKMYVTYDELFAYRAWCSVRCQFDKSSLVCKHKYVPELCIQCEEENVKQVS